MFLNFCVLFLFIVFDTSSCIQLRAYISEHGLHGEITFTQNSNRSITIETNLQPTLQYPNQVWSWAVSEFPVDYSLLENRCSNLGKILTQIDNEIGYLILPENNTISTVSEKLTISGQNGLFGKSLLLRNVENNRITCASLITLDKTIEKTAVAEFKTPIAGTVYFKWFLTKFNQSEMLISTDLYHVRNVENHNRTVLLTEHNWKIFVTDIINIKEHNSDNCNILQQVFDPSGLNNGASIGDLDSRLGKIKISTDYNRRKYKTLFQDEKLILLPGDLNGQHRRLYLVIFERKHPDAFLACSRIRHIEPVNAKVIIQSGGIKGNVTLTQRTKYEPTFLNFNLTTARGDIETKLVFSSSVSAYKIHEFPIYPAKTIEQTENACLSTKFLYNPLKKDVNFVPPNGFGTQEQYAVGDLTGKLFKRNNRSDILEGSVELKGTYWDVFLPLQGIHSVIHRSLIIYKNTQYPNGIISEPWICGSIVLYEPNFEYQKPVFTAEVVFRNPLVGRILFRQARDNPFSDTTIFVEYLIHADSEHLNNTAEHRWGIHDNRAGRDYFNWTGRCLSAGQTFNTYKVDFDNKTRPEDCNLETVGVCRVGDLSGRHGNLEIAASKVDAVKVSRRMFTDPHLPLTGHHGILGKSLVIFDDHAPVARGERHACTTIFGVFRRKAVVKDWFPNGDISTVKGKIEFYQQTEFDITNVEVDLQGLAETSGYHVHMTPVLAQLEFPCEGTTLYGHWNPLNVDPGSSPRNYLGTPDQYEMGDLSGKFGTLDNYTIYTHHYNDTMLPLFGPRSIVGRSIIIHKKKQNRRWTCSTIERGYSPSEAREIRAIASFHNPGGFAYGYIRLSQLVHRDGSKSDTIIEVNLRHPGKNDRNRTRDHDWAIYENAVGFDATLKTKNVRCLLGGYRWNPYYRQQNLPQSHDLYQRECSPDNPLFCELGDLSGRLGTINIGFDRAVFTDQNLPLEGDVHALGHSIIIFGPNKNSERLACANIEPDHDIIKYVNIEKPPRFVMAQFLQDVQDVMGVPEWMLSVDARKTRILHNGACVQFLLHFKGPAANKLEQDFTRLLVNGRLDAPSLYLHGYIDEKRKYNISYRLCSSVSHTSESNIIQISWIFYLFIITPIFFYAH